MGKDWERCTDKRTSSGEAHHLSFSIFYCGCKQPKSIHILISGAKVVQFERNAKEKALFPTTRWKYFLNAS